MASFRKLKSGKWQASIRKINHKYLYKTFLKKSSAKKWAYKTEVQIEENIYTDYGKLGAIKLNELVIKYRDEIVPNQKAKVSTTYKLNKLLRYKVSDKHLVHLRSSDVYNFQKELIKEKLSPKSVNTYIQLIKQIWNTARKVWAINLPTPSPLELVTLQKVDNERDRILNQSEYNDLLNAASKSKFNYLKDLIIFAYNTGARYSEIISLKRIDVNFEKKIAIFRDTKNGKDRSIPLSNSVIEILKKYPFGQNFFNIKNYDSFKFYFKQACKIANIKNFRFHDLRACFCTNALISGMSESEVASISGHLDWRSLKRYSRIKPEHLLAKINNIKNII